MFFKFTYLKSILLPKQVDCFFFLETHETVDVGKKSECFGSRGILSVVDLWLSLLVQHDKVKLIVYAFPTDKKSSILLLFFFFTSLEISFSCKPVSWSQFYDQLIRVSIA